VKLEDGKATFTITVKYDTRELDGKVQASRDFTVSQIKASAR
jgi:hypothetical protein